MVPDALDVTSTWDDGYTAHPIFYEHKAFIFYMSAFLIIKT